MRPILAAASPGSKRFGNSFVATPPPGLDGFDLPSRYYRAALESAAKMFEERQERRRLAGLNPIDIRDNPPNPTVPNDLKLHRWSDWLNGTSGLNSSVVALDGKLSPWLPGSPFPVLKSDFLQSVYQFALDELSRWKGMPFDPVLSVDGIIAFTPDRIRQREFEAELKRQKELDEAILAELAAQGANVDTIKKVSDETATDPLAREAANVLEDIIFPSEPVPQLPIQIPVNITRPLPAQLPAVPIIPVPYEEIEMPITPAEIIHGNKTVPATPAQTVVPSQSNIDRVSALPFLLGAGILLILTTKKR